MGMTLPQSAQWYVDQGFNVISIPFIKTGPVIDDWANKRFTRSDLDRYFANGPTNIGLLLSEPGGLTDVDADSIEALNAWIEFAIETGMTWGRCSMPASHSSYYCDPPLCWRDRSSPRILRNALVAVDKVQVHWNAPVPQKGWVTECLRQIIRSARAKIVLPSGPYRLFTSWPLLIARNPWPGASSEPQQPCVSSSRS